MTSQGWPPEADALVSVIQDRLPDPLRVQLESRRCNPGPGALVCVGWTESAFAVTVTDRCGTVRTAGR